MLFQLDDNGLVDDLIYDTPTHYLIEKVDSVNPPDTDLIITNMVNLEPLLEYFGYPENLTIHDLNEFYRKFIIRDR